MLAIWFSYLTLSPSIWSLLAMITSEAFIFCPTKYSFMPGATSVYIAKQPILISVIIL